MAITVKAQAKGLLRAARSLLAERSVPKDVRSALETLEGALSKTWADLESEAAETAAEPAAAEAAEPVAEAARETGAGPAPLREARNYGQWFEGRIHAAFSEMADAQFSDGLLTREERIALSSAIGDALDAFMRRLTQAAPQLYQRDPYGSGPMTEAARPRPGAEEAPLREELAGDVVPLIERSLRADGTTRVKVIEAGWGSSGYYPSEVLRRDGPTAFPAGTHMFVDHPTASGELERPERSLKELGGVLVSAARWEDDPQGGPGLYADAKVFSDFRTVLEEMAPHIGVSINADGVVREGKAEGRSGRIVASIRQGGSVDFVTQAGAGGRVMALYEAARTSGAAGAPAAVEEMGMDEKELMELREAKASADEQVARLQEALLLRDARDVAATELAKLELPEPTRVRILEAQVRRPVVSDGALDRGAFATQVREAATAELAYLAEATGAGQIVGMGMRGEPATAELEQRLNEAFRDLGLSESLAQKAARGR